MRLALGVPGPGVEVVNVCAPETMAKEPTEELLRRYHPGTEVRAPLPGRTVPVDLSKAERLLGFTAEYRLQM